MTQCRRRHILTTAFFRNNKEFELLASGTRLGSYEIISPLGSGGMGEVYRARDTKLKRDVAIKILPGAFRGDPEREARFQREAEALAALNHPNIAAIYDFGEANGSRFLVMELVEGQTLAERLLFVASDGYVASDFSRTRSSPAEAGRHVPTGRHVKTGPGLPVTEALDAAKQICDGLEAAHEKGITHRDLKPANIKITPTGQVKLLDFGLARVFEGDAAEAGLTNSPTLMSQTVPGAILGTAAYMSPEQARGQRADRQADVWAFGCVLYEMLTGKAVFGGDTVVEILSGTLKSDPDWTALPETTPPAIRSLLKRCLQKDRNRRLRDIADARFQIEEALNEPGSPAVAAAVAPARKSRERVWWIAAMLVLVAAASVVTALYVRRAPADAPEMRLEIVTPRGADLTSFAISPDGRKVVFRAMAEGRTQLWLRPLESETARPLAGTDNGLYPFWSPDSRLIGFFASGQLKRIEIAGGLVQTLTNASNERGGAWNGEGIILFAPSSSGPLYRVPAAGGEAVEATRLDPLKQTNHRFPHFLPDGRHFLFSALGTPEGRGVYLGSLDSTQTRRLFDADAAAVFAPPDYVLFVRQGALLAQHLHLDTWEPIGDPLPVAGQIAVNPVIFDDVALSASAVGPVAYRVGAGERQLIWFDPSGQRIGTVGGPDAAQPSSIRLSPDGRTVALRRTVSGNSDVWLIETARSVLRRFTFDATREYEAIWSSDGSRIVLTSDRKGVLDLYEKPVNGAETEMLLLASSEQKNPYDWSPNGRFILYGSQTPKAGSDIWALPLFGDRKPLAVAQTAFDEINGRFSPDGQWIAYQSNESGRNEIYVQPFPGPGGKSQISTGDGTVPQWRRDGRELFYLAPDNRLMAVPVTLNGTKVEAGTPVALFSTPAGSEYAAAPDGQRFLVNTITEEASPITVLLNWKPGAR